MSVIILIFGAVLAVFLGVFGLLGIGIALFVEEHTLRGRGSNGSDLAIIGCLMLMLAMLVAALAKWLAA